MAATIDNASRTARERARRELTEEIKTVGRRHLAEHGSAALSLRAVAREVGMVSSAVYRYFPSRDDLLTALIIDAYDAVGARAEAAEHATRTRDIAARWLAVVEAVRAWALENPHEYALIYGSPVPGYAAPEATIEPAARVPLALLRMLAEGCAAGEIETGTTPTMARAIRSDFAQLRRAAAPDVPDAVLSRGLAAWAQVLGNINLEMFGHLHNVIHDYDAFFTLQMRQACEFLVHGPVPRR
jgi:AcrR family transcriptional regulator